MVLRPEQDAYGQAMLDYLVGKEVVEIIERDDGYIDAGQYGYAVYFAPIAEWQPDEQRTIALARGRVLDVGCGPGRVALYLQEQGHEVVGIDYSPLAVETARRRGVRDVRVMRFEEVGAELGKFDTVVMFGNNFGLFRSWKQGKRLLRRLCRMTSAEGRILATAGDPYTTTEPDHLAYHERNRARGRMGGQLRLRIRYGKLRTPWFEYLFISPEELAELVSGTGWRVERLMHEHEFIYTIVLVKEGADLQPGCC